MNNKQRYKETFDTMVLSEERVRKVKSMIEKNEKRKIRRAGFRVAVTAAVLAAAFLIGNVAVYAATGNTLIEKGIKYISKKSVSREAMQTKNDKDGDIEMKWGDKEGSARVSVNQKYLEEEKICAVADYKDKKVEILLISRELEKKGGKVYLVIGAKEKRIDITKDFADGKAKGEFKLDGKTYQYDVSGTVKKYNINIAKKGE